MPCFLFHRLNFRYDTKSLSETVVRAIGDNLKSAFSQKVLFAFSEFAKCFKNTTAHIYLLIMKLGLRLWRLSQSSSDEFYKILHLNLSHYKSCLFNMLPCVFLM